MPESHDTHKQLAAIASLEDLFARRRTAYWIFGGWAVDLHVGRVTREHADIDIAVWASDRVTVTTMLRDGGWDHRPEAGEDGYTCFERATVRLEVAFLARDEHGEIYTPLADGHGDWPEGSFGDDVGSVGEVRARVVSRASLVVDKSAPRTDAATADKDRRDIASLQPPIVGR